jgi:uncharacterized protein YndB with AHSA1/START domain
MIDVSRFKPKTVYVTYIAASPEAVFAALTEADFTRQYFGGFAIDVEKRTGGAFRMLYPDGRVHISGRVLDWTPAKRFSCTWLVEGVPGFAELPECIVTYEIERAGEACRLTMTESHSWPVPDAILAGGRSGWPAILSGLKSLLETGKAPAIAMAPPSGFMDAVKTALRDKPWANETTGRQ